MSRHCRARLRETREPTVVVLVMTQLEPSMLFPELWQNPCVQLWRISLWSLPPVIPNLVQDYAGLTLLEKLVQNLLHIGNGQNEITLLISGTES